MIPDRSFSHLSPALKETIEWQARPVFQELKQETAMNPIGTMRFSVHIENEMVSVDFPLRPSIKSRTSRGHCLLPF
jgi:hypothetical protein